MPVAAAAAIPAGIVHQKRFSNAWVPGLNRINLAWSLGPAEHTYNQLTESAIAAAHHRVTAISGQHRQGRRVRGLPVDAVRRGAAGAVAHGGRGGRGRRRRGVRRGRVAASASAAVAAPASIPAPAAASKAAAAAAAKPASTEASATACAVIWTGRLTV